MQSHYIYLVLAIFAETIATSAINMSNGFTKLVPSLFGVALFVVALYFMSLALRVMPVGIVYATWAGLGIVTITLIGLVAFGQKLDWPAIIGMGMIIAGVVTIHVFSNSTHH